MLKFSPSSSELRVAALPPLALTSSDKLPELAMVYSPTVTDWIPELATAINPSV